MMWGILGAILGVFLLSQLIAQRIPSPGDWECQVLNKPDPLKFSKFDLKKLQDKVPGKLFQARRIHATRVSNFS
jgi:hypothetical protein